MGKVTNRGAITTNPLLRRRRAGRREQIRASGARKVITACDNRRHQITELGERYGMELTVQSVSEVLVDALLAARAGATA